MNRQASAEWRVGKRARLRGEGANPAAGVNEPVKSYDSTDGLPRKRVPVVHTPHPLVLRGSSNASVSVLVSVSVSAGRAHPSHLPKHLTPLRTSAEYHHIRAPVFHGRSEIQNKIIIVPFERFDSVRLGKLNEMKNVRQRLCLAKRSTVQRLDACSPNKIPTTKATASPQATKQIAVVPNTRLHLPEEGEETP